MQRPDAERSIKNESKWHLAGTDLCKHVLCIHLLQVEDYIDCCIDPLSMRALDKNIQHPMHHILQ